MNRPPLWSVLLEALADRTDWQRLRLLRYRRNRLGDPADELPRLCQHHRMVCDMAETDQTYLISLDGGVRACLCRLPPRLRTYLRQAERELSRQGPVGLRSSDQWEIVREWFALFCRLSVVSFRKRGEDSMLADPHARAFFHDVLERACHNGSIDANALTVGERIVALHFGYSIGRHLNFVLTTFDGEFATWRPGHLLRSKLVELAAARQNTVIDLFTGEKLYKRQWSNRQDAVLSIDLWPSSTMRTHVQRKVLRVVRGSPLLQSVSRVIHRHRPLLRWARRTKQVVRRAMAPRGATP